MSSSGDDDRRRKKPTMEDLIKEIREKTRQRQEETTKIIQKFMALADDKEESDPFKKDIAEAIIAIQFTTNSIWSEIQTLYAMEFVHEEEIRQLYQLVFSLSEAISPQTNNEVVEKWRILIARIKNLQQGMQ